MGIKFQSPIDFSAHRAIRYNSAAQTLVVTVATKTTAHPEYGNGSTDGYVVDGIEGPYLEFTPGNTYKFDQSDSSNANHPLRFYEDAAKTTAYTTGVTTSGVPGQSGAYTQIVPTTSVPPILYYQCSSHSLMGSYVKFGTGTIGDTYSINATQDGSNVDLNLDAATGTDSTVQLTAGSNVTLTRNNAQEITIAASGGGGGGNTYDLNATQDGSNVDLNLTSGDGSDNSTVQLTAGSNVTLTRNGAQELTIASNVSGTTINKNSFTGDGSDTTFTLSTSISNEDRTFVFIQGVYQEKSTYSISGTTLTFTTAPQNGYTIEVMTFDATTIGGPSISAIDWQSSIKTANFTATAGEGYFVNTTSNAVTVSLPAGSVGAKVSLQDYTGTFNSNNLLISANGSEKIQGLSSTTFSNSTNHARVNLVYQDATEGWTADNIIQPPVTASYLVIAGGAAGGGYYRAGGGGAGGLRTSYGSTSGGGASAESDLTLAAATNYTVTVGAGGAGAAEPANNGGSGSNSVFSTITSTGGGGGGRYTGGTGTAGAAGGSGGGGGGDSTGGAAGAGTANQGYAGGAGAGSNVQCGGGGGGAGAVGQTGGSGATSGDGGDGIQSAILNYANAGTASVGEQISGTQVWYSGGGGGGSYSSGNDTIPGKGGGGEGTNPSNYPTNGSPGTANTGGGGGGASGDAGIVGGAGGSGVVIIRYPSTNTLTAGAGLTQSSGSPFTEGSNKISVFTAGTGNISFS